MTEAAFPLLGAAFVVVVVLPLSALLARLVLDLLDRQVLGGPLRALGVRYLVLTGSSLLPLAWFCSAGLHQLESGGAALACLIDEHGASLCIEPGYFALALGCLLVGASLWTLRTSPGPRRMDPEGARALVARLESVAARAGLHALRGRVHVAADRGFAMGVWGWARPRVLVGEAFASLLSDEMLAGALGHEAAHVRALDPLRYFCLQLALAVNPCGAFLLARHARSWVAARELHCDREAVVDGTSPLALADAIVRAARARTQGAVALSAPDAAVLRLRVGMLLAFAEQAPNTCRHRGSAALPLAAACLLLASLLPHHTGTLALDAVHMGAERALAFVLP